MATDLPGLKSCPVCGKDLRGHRYALVAAIVDDPKESSRLQKFLSDIESRSWSEVLQFNEWRGESDVVQLYAIKCPTFLPALVLVRSPVELYDDDHTMRIECLTGDESSTLNALTERKNWKVR